MRACVCVFARVRALAPLNAARRREDPEHPPTRGSPVIPVSPDRDLPLWQSPGLAPFVLPKLEETVSWSLSPAPAPPRQSPRSSLPSSEKSRSYLQGEMFKSLRIS
jgi:hypothetical protein